MEDIETVLVACATLIWLSVIIFSKSIEILGMIVEVGLCVQISSYAYSYINNENINDYLVYGYIMIVLSTAKMLFI